MEHVTVVCVLSPYHHYRHSKFTIFEPFNKKNYKGYGVLGSWKEVIQLCIVQKL